LTYIKYSLDSLRPFKTAEAFEVIERLAYLPQRTWPQAAGWSSHIILLKSTAAISAVAMFVGDCTTASALLPGTADVINTKFVRHTVHGTHSACINPEVKRSRSRGYEVVCRRGYADRYDCLGFYFWLSFS